MVYRLAYFITIYMHVVCAARAMEGDIPPPPPPPARGAVGKYMYYSRDNYWSVFSLKLYTPVGLLIEEYRS